MIFDIKQLKKEQIYLEQLKLKKIYSISGAFRQMLNFSSNNAPDSSMIHHGNLCLLTEGIF